MPFRNKTKPNQAKLNYIIDTQESKKEIKQKQNKTKQNKTKKKYRKKDEVKIKTKIKKRIKINRLYR